LFARGFPGVLVDDNVWVVGVPPGRMVDPGDKGSVENAAFRGADMGVRFVAMRVEPTNRLTRLVWVGATTVGPVGVETRGPGEPALG